MLISIPSKIPKWQYATLFFCVLCSAICIMVSSRLPQETGVFLYLFSTYDTSASWLLAIVATMSVFCIDRSGRMESFFNTVANHTALVAFTAFSICALGARFIYHSHPFSMDEYSSLLQSQIFASGHLVGAIPRDLVNSAFPSPFHDPFLEIARDTGVIASAYWPGLPLVMAPFTYLGIPWLCNPTITAITFLALSRMLDALAVKPAVRGFAMFSTLSSPAILINGMSYYGMPLQLLCCLVFSLGMIKDNTRWLLIAGVFAALGLATVNPVPFGLYAIPWLVWSLTRRSRPFHKFALLASAGLPIALLLGLGWKVFLFEQFNHAQQAREATNLHSMLDVFTLPNMQILFSREIGLIKLYLWVAPGLPILAYLACRHQWKEKWVRLFAASTACLLIGYLFVPFDQGHGWGYRYFHAAWFVLPVLSAIMLQRISEDAKLRRRAFGFAFAASIGSFLFLVPLRSYQTESLIREQLQQLPPPFDGNGHQIVFVKPNCGFISVDLIQNDPFLHSQEIRLISKGFEENARLAALLGSKPRLVSSAACGNRWLVE
jgi:hypothetical protein